MINEDFTMERLIFDLIIDGIDPYIHENFMPILGNENTIKNVNCGFHNVVVMLQISS